MLVVGLGDGGGHRNQPRSGISRFDQIELAARPVTLPGTIGRLLNDPASKCAMLPHRLVFVIGQFARLEQNGIGNPDLADIVQQ